MNIFEYRDRLIYVHVLEKVREDPIYYKRTCVVEPDRVDEYRKSRFVTLLQSKGSLQDSELIKSFSDIVEYQLTNVRRRYETVFESVAFDECGYLELAGVTKLMRKYIYVVDLADCLDIFLAFMCGDSIENVRDGLEDICQKADIPYRLLSRAWMAQETYLYKYLKQCNLADISSKMSVVCQRILNKGYSLGGMREFQHVNIYKLSREGILSLAVQSQLLMDMHFVLSECIIQYDTMKAVNGDVLLMSKGISFLVFTSNSPSKELVFNMNLRRDLPLQIRAVGFERGTYPSKLVGDGLKCVELVE